MPTLYSQTTSTDSESPNSYAWGYSAGTSGGTDEGSTMAVDTVRQPTAASYGTGYLWTSNGESATIILNCQPALAAYSTLDLVRVWVNTPNDALPKCAVKVGASWSADNSGQDGSTSNSWAYFDFAQSVSISSSTALQVKLWGSDDEDMEMPGIYLELTTTYSPPPASGKLLPMITSAYQAYQDDTTEF